MEGPERLRLAHLNCGQSSVGAVLEAVAARIETLDPDILHLQELWLTPQAARHLRRRLHDLFPGFHLSLDHTQTRTPQQRTLAMASLVRQDIAQYTTRIPLELAAADWPDPSGIWLGGS